MAVFFKSIQQLEFFINAFQGQEWDLIPFFLKFWNNR